MPKPMTERRREYLRHLNSAKWKGIQQEVLARSGYRCKGCGTTKRLQVHHLVYTRFGNEDIDDLIVLCKDCHWKAHHKSKRRSSRYQLTHVKRSAKESSRSLSKSEELAAENEWLHQVFERNRRNREATRRKAMMR